jgi:2,3-diketo-5-methylthio-1-phosphopentane phosphatase
LLWGAVGVAALSAGVWYCYRKHHEAAAHKRFDAIVLDIEGTTTPISFVHSILFPYVSKELDTYIRTRITESETMEDVRALRDLSLEDEKAHTKGVIVIPPFPTHAAPTAAELEPVIAATIANVRWQMSSDRKSTALKRLQGHMWRVGYENGSLISQLFEDVVPAMKRWNDKGIKCYIYSSGSIDAQKLLFGYTSHGSVLPLLKGHFDTTSGMKQEVQSYRNIIAAIGTDPSRTLFLTDIYGEAKAAAQAGLHVGLMLRPENAPLPADNSFPTAHSFAEIRV